ncbi:MAG TPA: tol-pal system protein YbgF, partial [Devosia sp.]|nr:tol-pal system protein YbgF [Devosia sp.]
GDGIGTFDPAGDGVDVPGLDFDPAALVSQGDADAQYSAGYDAIVRGDYEFAESQFRQFISLFPDDLHAPDAANWLGESLLQQHRYDEAAQILFDGFENYPNSLRAPDLLLKLAIALDGAGEREVACRTFGEVLRRFPSVQPAFRQRLASEMARAKC